MLSREANRVKGGGSLGGKKERRAAHTHTKQEKTKGKGNEGKRARDRKRDSCAHRNLFALLPECLSTLNWTQFYL